MAICRSGFIPRQLSVNPCKSRDKPASTNRSIGFQPVTSIFANRQYACFTLSKWTLGLHYRSFSVGVRLLATWITSELAPKTFI